MSSFDPYPDFSKISQEQAEELQEAFKEYKELSNLLIGDATPETAGKVLQAHHDLSVKCDDVIHDIWTVPVMVHVADDPKWEKNPDDDDQEALLQRCSRCKSVLQFWHEKMIVMGRDGGTDTVEEEDIPWWEAGTMVAKSTDQRDPMIMNMSMYEVEPGRDLEKHERECVGFPELDQI